MRKRLGLGLANTYGIGLGLERKIMRHVCELRVDGLRKGLGLEIQWVRVDRHIWVRVRVGNENSETYV